MEENGWTLKSNKWQHEDARRENIFGKKREEVTSYLAIMQTIVSKGNNWEKVKQFADLEKMGEGFSKICNEI